jgi:hypothetical protein
LDTGESVLHSEGGGSSARLDAALAAALELKVRLDAARQQARLERARTRQAMDIAAALVELVRDATNDADELDDLASGYSDALTQLLVPPNPAAAEE